MDVAETLLRDLADATAALIGLDGPAAIRILEARDRALAHLGDDEPSDWIVTKYDDYGMTVVDSTGGTELRLAMNDEASCSHLWEYKNDRMAGTEAFHTGESDENLGYLHLCGLDSFIDRLSQVRMLRDKVKAGWAPPPCPHEYKLNQPGEPDICQACGHLIFRPGAVHQRRSELFPDQRDTFTAAIHNIATKRQIPPVALADALGIGAVWLQMAGANCDLYGHGNPDCVHHGQTVTADPEPLASAYGEARKLLGPSDNYLSSQTMRI